MTSYRGAQALKAAIKAVPPPVATTSTKMSTRPTNRGGESIEQRLKVIKYRSNGNINR